jgi:hypothetical protein
MAEEAGSGHRLFAQLNRWETDAAGRGMITALN